MQLYGAVLERVVMRGGKIDYLNLRQAKLPWMSSSRAACWWSRTSWCPAWSASSSRDCALKSADFTGVTLTDVDLRGVVELGLAGGVDRLSGAVISSGQLLDLAPAFAAHPRAYGRRTQGDRPAGRRQLRTF